MLGAGCVPVLGLRHPAQHRHLPQRHGRRREVVRGRDGGRQRDAPHDDSVPGFSERGDVATADYLNRLQSTHKNNFVHHITCHCERCSSCHMQVLTEILANGIIWQIKKGNDF